MDWHQPWLLALNTEELEELHDACRYRSKAMRKDGQWGLAYAWQGLAHEVLERALELYAREQPTMIDGQLALPGAAPGSYHSVAAATALELAEIENDVRTLAAEDPGAPDAA